MTAIFVTLFLGINVKHVFKFDLLFFSHFVYLCMAITIKSPSTSNYFSSGSRLSNELFLVSGVAQISHFVDV